MGLELSPYHAICFTLIAEGYLTDFLCNSDNPFRYSEVSLNLPGTNDYVPGVAWFSILRETGELAAILAIFVDNERVHAPSELDAKVAARQVECREFYLEIQDAARKRRPPSQQPVTWAGSIVRTNNEEVVVLISDERWMESKIIINKWAEQVVGLLYQNLDTKDLLSAQSFLVYVYRTYDVFVPYLKGIHLRLDGQRNNRDNDGWKMSDFHPKIKQSINSNQVNSETINAKDCLP